MLDDALHQPLAQSAPTMRLQYKYITQISHGGKVTDHAGKTHLRTASIIDAEAQRVLNRSRHDFPRNALGPVTIRQETVVTSRLRRARLVLITNSPRRYSITSSESTMRPVAMPTFYRFIRAPSAAALGDGRAHPSNAVRKNEASCQPSIYLYGVSPIV